MASFLSLLQPAVLLMLPAVFATMIYLGLGGVLGAFLLRLKQVAFVLVNVPLGIWCLTHGWFVAGTATLGVGLGVGIGVVEYFVDPVSPPLQTARLWTLAVGLVAVVILFVQGACGYYPEAPKRTRSRTAWLRPRITLWCRITRRSLAICPAQRSQPSSSCCW